MKLAVFPLMHYLTGWHGLRFLEKLTPIDPADITLDLSAFAEIERVVMRRLDEMLTITFVVVERLAAMAILVATRIVNRCLDALVHQAPRTIVMP